MLFRSQDPEQQTVIEVLLHRLSGTCVAHADHIPEILVEPALDRRGVVLLKRAAKALQPAGIEHCPLAEPRTDLLDKDPLDLPVGNDKLCQIIPQSFSSEI